MSQKYVRLFYSIFPTYSDDGFYSDVKTIRRKLQEDTCRYIPIKYVIYSIEVFCDAGLLELYNKIYAYSKFELMNYTDIKTNITYKWCKVKTEQNDVERKLNELSKEFSNYINETELLITNDEISKYNLLYLEKHKMAFEILGDNSNAFFNKKQLKTYKPNIQNIKRSRFKDKYIKLEKLVKDDFIKYKAVIDYEKQQQLLEQLDYSNAIIAKMNFEEKSKQKFGNIIQNICKIIEDNIAEYGYVYIVLCNNKKSILFGEIMIKSIQYKMESQMILMKKEFDNIEAKPSNLTLSGGYIIFCNQDNEEEFMVILKETSPEKISYLEFLFFKYEEALAKLYSFGF